MGDATDKPEIDRHPGLPQPPLLATLKGFILLWVVLAPLGTAAWLLMAPVQLARWLLRPKRKADCELRAQVVGDEGADETVVMMHGFPDNAASMAANAERFAAAGFKVVLIDLPSSEGQHVGWGVSLPEVVEALKVLLDKHSPSKPVVLYVHDWGAIYGYAFEQKYPGSVKAVVALDVAGQSPGNLNFMASVMNYQLYSAYAFLLGGTTGALMMQGMMHGMGGSYHVRPIASITADMAFHYLRILWGIVAARPGFESVRSRGFHPQKRVPVFFGFGTKRRGVAFFCSKSWLRSLHETPKCAARGYPTDHWLHVNMGDKLDADVIAWLRAIGIAPTKVGGAVRRNVA